MSYEFLPGRLYRMPTHFGPALGPRQGEDGRQFACRDSPKTLAFSVGFLTRREQLERLLPPGFAVGDEPVVTVTASFMKEIEWLAGRGYNMLGVSFPAVFQGKRDRASGDFLAVLWENLCEPIITGREELGYSKIWAEIPEPRHIDGRVECSASWDGFRFLTMEIDALTAASPPAAPADTGGLRADTGGLRADTGGLRADTGGLRGVLHYKYLPRTGDRGRADAAYATLTPATAANRVVLDFAAGSGTIAFHRARWEDMPTQCTIVNTLADLEILEFRAATRIHSIGGRDLRDQRTLE